MKYFEHMTLSFLMLKIVELLLVRAVNYETYLMHEWKKKKDFHTNKVKMT